MREVENTQKYLEKLDRAESEKGAMKTRIDKLLEIIQQFEIESMHPDISKLQSVNSLLEQKKKELEIIIEN